MRAIPPLYDVKWAVHTTRQGRWWAFERYTGKDVGFGEYPSESEAIHAIRAIDATGMIRINQMKVIGGPSLADILKWSIETIRAFFKAHPGHVGASNALRQVESNTRAQAALSRAARCNKTVSGKTKERFSHTGPSCPTKRELL